MSTWDIERLSYAELVLRRPCMWTAGGTLAEIFAFLNGYDAATRTDARCQDLSPDKLLEWVANECGFSRALCPPAEQVAQIVRHFGSAELAIEAMSARATRLRESLAAQRTNPEKRE